MTVPEPALAAWVEETLEGTARSWQRTSGGGSREAYFVDVVRASGQTIRALLRMEAGGSFAGTDINVSKEAAIYRALGSAGIRVPKVYGLAPGGTALLLERVAGRGDLGEGPVERQRTLEDFIDVIADMHLVDIETLDLPGFPRPRSVEDHARLDLGLWAGLADDHVVGLDPLARYAGAWLAAHPPASVSRTSVIQGDTGPGNFVADHGRVTALCDMEFSHLGDPMDDIAWIVSRGFGSDRAAAAPFLDRYTARTGIPIDWSSVDYYNIAVQYRCVITTSLAVSRGGGARGWAPYVMVTQRYLRMLAPALAEQLGAEDVVPTVPQIDQTPRTSWFDAVMGALRSAAKAIPDPDLANDARNHQILIHYLRAYDRVGAAIDTANVEDLKDTTGIEADALDLDARIEEAGTAADTEVLGYLLRRQHRIDHLWKSLIERDAGWRAAG